MKVGVSFISSKFDLDTTIKKIDESCADYIHVDMMDGNFVENKNYSVEELKKMFADCQKKLDVHLMVCSPNKYIKQFSKFKNVEYFIFHYEAHRKPIDVINMLKHTSMKIGIAINPETKVTHILPLLAYVDQVLVMSVNPGRGGQEFMESVLYKVEALRDAREENGYHYIISIDGGINDKTIDLARDAGVDMVVSGSFVCKSDDYDGQIKKLKL